MSRFSLIATLLLATVCLSQTASAGVVFEDNFDNENGGLAGLNYTTFDNWTVGSGTVDVIGNNMFDPIGLTGLYVDLDGSTQAGGTLVSRPLNLAAGTYQLEFDLAGNNRNPNADTINVTFANYSETFVLDSSDPFRTFTRIVELTADEVTALSFEDIGGDDNGALLDNVRIMGLSPNPVPEPASVALFGLGALGVGLALHRRRARRCSC